MPELQNRQYLEFENADQGSRTSRSCNSGSPLKRIKWTSSASITQLEEKIVEKKKEIMANLTSWQKVQLSRHPDRPYTLAYIKRMVGQFRGASWRPEFQGR
ncbi:MAG: hypothetical protein MZW92_17065 [Comamonadaceae bacterium]|nr:hypothetical protein [Comamonadaceae bacterium]